MNKHVQIDRRIRYFLIFSLPLIVLVGIFIYSRKTGISVPGETFKGLPNNKAVDTETLPSPSKINICLAPQKSQDKKTIELFLNDKSGFSRDRSVQIYVLGTGSFTLVTLTELTGEATDIPLSVVDTSLFKKGEELRFIAVQGESFDLSVYMDEARGCPVFIN